MCLCMCVGMFTYAHACVFVFMCVCVFMCACVCPGTPGQECFSVLSVSLPKATRHHVSLSGALCVPREADGRRLGPQDRRKGADLEDRRDRKTERQGGHRDRWRQTERQSMGPSVLQAHSLEAWARERR